MKNVCYLFLTVYCTTLYSHEEDGYRRFDENTPDSVKAFYLENHANQTVDFVLQKKEQYSHPKTKMGIWDAVQLLDSIVDASDPDISLPQSYHAYQTAEALRRDGFPRWMILTGFIHDLGKLLTTFGEPQWAVVGDTFPVGCAFSNKIVFHEYFLNNPDTAILEYQTLLGIYSENCGFDNLFMSWGHDEYLYQVLKNYLPPEALYIIRYHSFYPAHKENAYSYFMNDFDNQMMPWLKLFCQYDLYSKEDEKINIDALSSYYIDLINEFLPNQLDW